MGFKIQYVGMYVVWGSIPSFVVTRNSRSRYVVQCIHWGPALSHSFKKTGVKLENLTLLFSADVLTPMSPGIFVWLQQPQNCQQLVLSPKRLAVQSQNMFI